jgi:DNA-binding CsgD family transcriptional regulator
MASSADLNQVRLGRLTDRQRELLALVAAGHSNARAALMLGLSVGTVKKHLEHIFDRLGVDSRLAAARVYLDGAATQPDWWSVEGVVSTLTSSPA